MKPGSDNPDDSPQRGEPHWADADAAEAHRTGPHRLHPTSAEDHHIVYLDPVRDRPVSPYSPEGEIRMMGDFAAGLSRRALPKHLVIGLILIILLPILVSVVAVISTWMP